MDRENVYTVTWSDEDDEWVATVSSHELLSYLGDSPSEALDGLLTLLVEP